MEASASTSRRSSARLAKKRSADEQLVPPSSSSTPNKDQTHRPKPGRLPHQNDCGILPGE
ncbi:hypothetical protein ACHAW6_008454 [Cyclotella cf. meneghiniana]